MASFVASSCIRKLVLYLLLLFSSSPPSSNTRMMVNAFSLKPRKTTVLPRHQHQRQGFDSRQVQQDSRVTTSLLHLRGGGTSTTSTQLQAVFFDNGPLTQYNLVLVAANAIGFLVSMVSGGSHLHLDLIGTGAYAIAALGGLSSSVPRIQLSSSCVALWATKLASFLFFRALKTGHDARLTDTLSTTTGTAAFWILSALWGIFCSLPHSLGSTSSFNPTLAQSPTSIVGTALFIIGFLTETLADVQKWNFKQIAANKGQFCNVGLWSISQHPNFLGNLLLWTGIFILNAPALIEAPSSSDSATLWQTLWGYRRLVLAALLSPVLLYAWFYGQASGSVSNTQELALKKYGDNPAYQSYIDNVPLIVPNNPFQILVKWFSNGKK